MNFFKVIISLIMMSVSFVAFGESLGELVERLGTDIAYLIILILRIVFVVGIGFAIYALYVVIIGIKGSYAGPVSKAAAVLIFLGSIGVIYFTAIVVVDGKTIFGPKEKPLNNIEGLK